MMTTTVAARDGRTSSASVEPDAAVAISQRECVVTIACAADEAEWDAFVTSEVDATGYHYWAWRSVFVRAFGHEPIYLIARRGAAVVGVLPLVHINSRLFGRSLTSLPFLNYGGVVAHSELAANRLLEKAEEVGRTRRCRHVELRHIGRRFPELPCRQHKVAMLLPLERGIWERLDRKVRNQIRKAQKSELAVERGGAELRHDFYAVFARNMRDLGTPVYSPRLFDEVLETFSGVTSVHVVRRRGRPIAAGLTYRHGHTVEVPWASSIRDYNSLCPNHLLYWSVIEAAVADGCSILDFGRSTPDGGTFNFKQQWGARPVPLHWEYRLIEGTSVPDVSPTNARYRLAIEMWKRLPLPLTTRLGPRIVRGIA
jgi:FemAB-related protein (PEP-CTERM system-associated)